MLLTLNGIYVQEIKPGEWHVCLSPLICPPAGSISSTVYSSHADALAAAKEGKFE